MRTNGKGKSAPVAPGTRRIVINPVTRIGIFDTEARAHSENWTPEFRESAEKRFRQLAPDELERAGVSEDMVRLSVGIEHIEDLLADIGQALRASQLRAAA